MQNEDTEILRRFHDLAERSYSRNIYTYSDFLTPAEAGVFFAAEREFDFTPWELSGGVSDAERRMLRFGSEEVFGYDEPWPLRIIKISPKNDKFADELSHRDYLGAILNLGIERDTLGDFIISGKDAYIVCEESVAGLIENELDRIRHNSVECRVMKTEDYAGEAPVQEYTEMTETVASERADLITAKAARISRAAAQEKIRGGLLSVNGRTLGDPAATLKKGDVFSLRGSGKYIYDGPNYTNKKGKINITVRKYK